MLRCYRKKHLGISTWICLCCVSLILRSCSWNGQHHLALLGWVAGFGLFKRKGKAGGKKCSKLFFKINGRTTCASETTSLKATQMIERGTEERAASNCYGNWNFANKYFSIACFSNKLNYSFHSLVLLLFPLSSLCKWTLLPIIPWNEKEKYSFLRLFITLSPVKSSNTLFAHTLRQDVSIIQKLSPSTSVIMEVWLRQELPPKTDNRNSKGLLMTCESPDFCKLPFPSVHGGMLP